MSLVATLIHAPAKPALGADHVRLAQRTLESLGARQLSTAWLTPGEAVDLRFSGVAALAARDALEAAFARAPLDIAVQPVADRRKGLLVADMDSTIIAVECIDELADFAGLKPQVAAITEAAMRGELDFEAALRQRVGLLAGMPVDVLARCYEERVRLNPGAKTLVATMAAHGAYCALVSGGFTYFTERVAALAGFHFSRANVLESRDGVLTGQVRDPIAKADTKLRTLEELMAAHGLTRAQTMAVGDGANDIPMLQAAGLSVAYRGKPKAMAAAAMRVRHGDLTTLLFAQGYGRAAFAAA
ncbi:MAG: phosphoserine phosphatase SerB [Alphaproteobacteria bacterium]|nr:MAG: phosphoserine phosphatase SerB [Alphaproteobacteria bacterium]